MKILLLDGYNLIYRARYSFQRGSHPTIYSFFRSLRPLIEKFDPDIAYFVIEGCPADRLHAYPDYKANRPKEKDDSFRRQKDEIIKILKESFPLIVVRHPRYECDDVIGHLVRFSHPYNQCTIVSTDSDFLQLYNDCTNVKIYNPIKKEIAPPPEFAYVDWKALRGDSSDNIHGIRGIGDKRALNLVNDRQKLDVFLNEDTRRKDIFRRNRDLIRFADLNGSLDEVEFYPPTCDWEGIKQKFDEMEFSSITNPKPWLKFQKTFERLSRAIP